MRGSDVYNSRKLWAEDKGVPHKPFPVTSEEWARIGPKAGPLRNMRMLTEGCPDLVVAFSGGRGTASMKRIAKAAGVHVITVTL